MFAAEWNAVPHHARDGDADRTPGPGEVAEQLDEDLGDGVGGRGGGRLDPLALLRELALLQVDGRALDTRAAEIDAERKISHAPTVTSDRVRSVRS